MTAHGTAGPLPDFLASLSLAMRRGWRLIGRLLIGGLFILGAGILALATAVLGLLIAVAAIILRYTRGGDRSFRRTTKHASSSDQTGQEDGFTLDARPTAKGWTVE